MVRPAHKPVTADQAKRDLRDAVATCHSNARQWLASHALEMAAGAFIVGFALGAEPRVARRIREVALPLVSDGLAALAEHALAIAAASVVDETKPR